MNTTTDGGNLTRAIAAGLAAALVGALLWAVITVLTGYQIGFMAIGVGFLVGFAVRMAGKGSTVNFQIVGAVCALLGCVLGNLLSICGIIAKEESVPIMSAVGSVFGSPATAVELMQVTFSAMDLLFYGLAIYEGYKLSVVPLVSETPPQDAPK